MSNVKYTNNQSLDTRPQKDFDMSDISESSPVFKLRQQSEGGGTKKTKI